MKSKISRVIAIYLNRISVYFYYTAKPAFLNDLTINDVTSNLK